MRRTVALGRGLFGRRRIFGVTDVRRQNDTHKQPRHAIYATETSGLLLIALLLLVLTAIRYWHAMQWSLR